MIDSCCVAGYRNSVGKKPELMFLVFFFAMNVVSREGLTLLGVPSGNLSLRFILSKLTQEYARSDHFIEGKLSL